MYQVPHRQRLEVSFTLALMLHPKLLDHIDIFDTNSSTLIPKVKYPEQFITLYHHNWI